MWITASYTNFRFLYDVQCDICETISSASNISGEDEKSEIKTSFKKFETLSANICRRLFNNVDNCWTGMHPNCYINDFND